MCHIFKFISIDFFLIEQNMNVTVFILSRLINSFEEKKNYITVEEKSARISMVTSPK